MQSAHFKTDPRTYQKNGLHPLVIRKTAIANYVISVHNRSLNKTADCSHYITMFSSHVGAKAFVPTRDFLAEYNRLVCKAKAISPDYTDPDPSS